MKFRTLLFFLFSLLLKSNVTLANGSTQEKIKLSDAVLYYEDTTGILQITDIVFFKNTDFKEYRETTKLRKDRVYWAKLTVRNKTEYSIDKILIIGKKRHSDFAQMYVFNHNNQIKYAESGFFLQKNKKDVKTEIGSKFKIHLKAHEEYEIYLRIQNISGYSPAFDVTLVEELDFYNDVASRNLVFGFIVGILWIMLFYNLLIYVYNRDLVYIYYSLYVLGMIFNLISTRGLFIEYITPEFPKADPFVFIIATGLATASYFQFLRLFLNTKIDMPKWDKTLLAIVWANIIATIYLTFDLLINFNVPLSINVSNLLNFAVLLIGLAFIIYLLKHKSSLALFFMIGTGFLVVGTVSSLVFIMGKIDFSINPTHLMNAGVVGQILFFSLGLGFKISLIEKAKVKMQEDLIEQLKKNEELKDQVNRELEGKIKERTKEIQLKNDQLNEYAQNLVDKNNLLIESNEEINQQKEEIQAIVEMLRETNEKVVEQNREIEKVNQNITDSINSAKRIQSAMLPSEKAFEANFVEHFIIYLPRDIVSGDFYWLRKIGKFVVIIAADSTGHGVPGAFVSMMGMAFLNEIVGNSETTQANQVLDQLRDHVKNALNQAGSEHKLSDGMDIALCVIDVENKILQFSGANNPLFIVRKCSQPAENTHELIHLKPDRQPIGAFIKEQPFTNHNFDLQQNDTLYLFSDGIVDQFGGEYNDKFKSQRFKKLLLEIQNEPLTKQKELILEAYENWKGRLKQVDDIVVLGIKPC